MNMYRRACEKRFPSHRGVAGIRVLVVFLFLAVLSPTVRAIPNEILITGVLQAENEEGELEYVTGSFPMQLRFRESESPDAPVVAIVLTTATATGEFGYFQARVPLPDDVLTLEQLWCFVAVDVDNDGFDAGDSFPEPVRMHAVPFALTARAVDFFDSHGGRNKNGTSYTNHAGRIAICPFSTPPGGVRFTHISAGFDPSGTSGIQEGDIVTCGVYDDEGRLVYSSPKLDAI